jgi:NAD(P)-dependent dehydrogenase (short-subunit alcohol dehydrogenase family)
MELEGLKAIVTGGASGIGAATACLLRERGAQVAILDRALGARIDGQLAVECDIAADDSVRAAVERVAAELDGIDLVINNAGIGAQGTIEANDDQEWHRVFDINVVGM